MPSLAQDVAQLQNQIVQELGGFTPSAEMTPQVDITPTLFAPNMTSASHSGHGSMVVQGDK